MPVEQAYTIVIDAAAAEAAACHAIEQGDLDRLSAIATAAPILQTREPTWTLIASVLLLAQDDVDEAHEAGRQLAEAATPIQRRAIAIRLRALRDHQSDLPGLSDLIEIINPENKADPVSPSAAD